jgi:Pentapeptide repeats (8 copies)
MTDVPRSPEGQALSGNQQPSDATSEIIQSLLTRLKGNTDLAQLERTLNLAKLHSEIQKLDAEKRKADEDAKKSAVDASLASKQVRHSLTSSMLAPLVPLTSLATVIVTLYIANTQTHVARDQAREKSIEDRLIREEASWKAFEDDLNKSFADALYATGTFVSRLRTFDASDSHKLQLKDINKQFMARLSSDSAFKDMWKIAIKNTTEDNFETVVDLARGKKYQFDRIVADCAEIKIPPGTLSEDIVWNYLGACSPKYTQEEISTAISDPSLQRRVSTLRESMNSVSSIQWFLSLEIGNFLRKTSTREKGGKPYDLSNVTLHGADFDGVNFSQMNLSQTVFSTSTVNGAVLTAKTMTYDFRGTPWWEADIVDQAILPWLITYHFPYNPAEQLPSGYKITADEYQAKIGRLCTEKMIACSQGCLRFGQTQASMPVETCAATR